MTEIRSVMVCAQCEVHWYLGHEQVKCTDSQHNHQQFDLHLHRSLIDLPRGTEVTALSYDETDPYARDRTPDYGLYFDPIWKPPWTHDHLDWPDFSVPRDSSAAAKALLLVLERARGHERVEVGCLGGHGRTGTALACLAIMSGLSPGSAVAWVRENYCAKAVESPQQEAFVAGFVG